ncbi:MAG: riboflavin biosynthesis protein [Candidatus Hepatoplasma vulgare]|nr:MAG: riboflavin biosynthesis protein [Candidatus Hepatoplasma sp.]
MKIIEFDIDFRLPLNKEKEKVIALGKFIGFHKGHQKIFKKAKEISLKENKELIIMLYSDYDGFLKDYRKSILPLETRLKIIKQYNPDYILIFEENKKNYEITREDFFKYLKDYLNVKNVVIGKNFTLNKKDGKDDLLEFKQNFSLSLLPLEKYNGQIISTKLLDLILIEGKVEEYKKLTNFNYFYQGKIIPGKLLGTKYKTPTANVSVFSSLKTPREGIYTSYITVDNLKYYSITSISTNPTFDEKKISYETFILKFNNNIYGKEVTVELLKFIREPKKFRTIKLLYDEIELDKKRAMNYFNI